MPNDQLRHTPEPWRVLATEFKVGIYPDSGGKTITATGRVFPIDQANARRIVACVNYCQGVSTAELEAAPKGVMLRAILDALDSAVAIDETRALLAKVKS